jgi:hypothetical protein
MSKVAGAMGMARNVHAENGAFNAKSARNSSPFAPACPFFAFIYCFQLVAVNCGVEKTVAPDATVPEKKCGVQ